MERRKGEKKKKRKRKKETSSPQERRGSHSVSISPSILETCQNRREFEEGPVCAMLLAKFLLFGEHAEGTKFLGRREHIQSGHLVRKVFEDGRANHSVSFRLHDRLKGRMEIPLGRRLQNGARDIFVLVPRKCLCVGGRDRVSVEAPNPTELQHGSPNVPLVATGDAIEGVVTSRGRQVKVKAVDAQLVQVPRVLHHRYGLGKVNSEALEKRVSVVVAPLHIGGDQDDAQVGFQVIHLTDVDDALQVIHRTLGRELDLVDDQQRQRLERIAGRSISHVAFLLSFGFLLSLLRNVFPVLFRILFGGKKRRYKGRGGSFLVQTGVRRRWRRGSVPDVRGEERMSLLVDLRAILPFGLVQQAPHIHQLVDFCGEFVHGFVEGIDGDETRVLFHELSVVRVHLSQDVVKHRGLPDSIRSDDGDVGKVLWIPRGGVLGHNGLEERESHHFAQGTGGHQRILVQDGISSLTGTTQGRRGRALLRTRGDIGRRTGRRGQRTRATHGALCFPVLLRGEGRPSGC
mmetsp:Transcript_15285/g.38598  ORF Transcript_15285/g.38598 Transcript_15285/m.38598 type:complete len:516 (+) Transcript_15285:554-2101(+)